MNKKFKFKLTKEAIKESGKLLFDFTKVVFAVALIAPFVNDTKFSIFPVLIGMTTAGIGLYLINKGTSDE